MENRRACLHTKIECAFPQFIFCFKLFTISLNFWGRTTSPTTPLFKLIRRIKIAPGCLPPQFYCSKTAFISFRLYRIAERKAHLEKLKSSKEQAATPEEKAVVEEELERTQLHLDELSTKLAEAEEADDSDWTSVSSDEPDTEEYTVNPREFNS